MEVPHMETGGPIGGGLNGVYHSCEKLIVGLVTVDEKVAALVVAQVMACDTGLTLFTGTTVFEPITIVCV